jgi:hypothetical protein
MNRVNVTGIGSGILLVRKVSGRLQNPRIQSTPLPLPATSSPARPTNKMKVYRPGEGDELKPGVGNMVFIFFSLGLFIFYVSFIGEESKRRIKIKPELSARSLRIHVSLEWVFGGIRRDLASSRPCSLP